MPAEELTTTENIPEAIRSLPQWVCWKKATRKGKLTKLPMKVGAVGDLADSTKKETWSSFEAALKWHADGHYNGIGFVFTKDDRFCGIDLDDCRDSETGEVNEFASELLKTLNSYTEISQSGKGLHIFVEAKLPGAGRKVKIPGTDNEIEIYDRGRYFTMTGKRLMEYPAEIQERKDEVLELYHTLLYDGKTTTTKQKSIKQVSPTVSDQDIIKMASEAKNGQKFSDLMAGNWESYYPSESEADGGMAAMVGFWTQDFHQILRIIQGSGLADDKWNREDYQESTINGALAILTDFWSQDTRKGTISEPKSAAGGGLDAKEATSPYFSKNTFIPPRLANTLMSEHTFLNAGGQLYIYKDGVFNVTGREFIRQECRARLQDEGRINRVNEVIAHIEDMTHIKPDELNTSSQLINLQNGMLDWQTKELLPHDPEYRSTMRIPVRYDPDVEWREVAAFLSSTLPGDCMDLALELFGYVLIPDMRFHKAFMLTGGGSNGKSTFLDLLEAFVGSENICEIPIQELCENRFKRAELHGKLVNLFADLDARALYSTTYFKTVVSGDAIDAERKHCDPFNFRPFARLIFSANEVPLSKNDNSFAYFRRWCIIPFQKRFTGDDADKKMREKITTPAELSGLLNWALKGLDRLWKQQDFSQPETVKEALKDYQKANDSVAAFIDDQCEIVKDAEIERGALYDAYSAYCDYQGYDTLTRRACYDKVKLHDVKEKRLPKQRLFVGIQLSGA